MMPKDELGRLERVDVRAYWPDEARDFTPWLAENIHLLNEAIGGLDLEVEEQESRVGDFRTDLVCRAMNEPLVIVENQFGKTDHDHLGKLLTYAGGKDAAVIVWVAEDFRDEHRAALDWLNEHTAGDVHVFGVQIELWKIGDSAPAPRFNVVSKPNDWVETVRHTGDMSEAQKLRVEFWTGLRVVMEQKQGNVGLRAPSKENWVDFAIGGADFGLQTICSTDKKRIDVRLRITGQKAKAYYHRLFQQKDAVEREIGDKLEWRELPRNKQSDVTLSREDCDVLDKAQWGDYHSWLHEYLEKFHAAFSPLIKDLKAEDVSLTDVQDEDDD